MSRLPAADGLPARAEVVGIPISMTSYQEVLELIATRPAHRARTFAFCNVHSVMTARRDPAVRAALEATDVTTSDGVPLVWALRLTAHPAQQRVYGPDLMALALPHGLAHGWKHYFYGATEETLARLHARASELAPGVQVVGMSAPPFRSLTVEERQAAIDDIRSSGADCLWVGLGMPKQELWMHEVASELPGVAVLAVGAAFDFLAGTVRQAPRWMMRLGLEWAYRLAQEPRRLWRRYLVNNPAFLFALALQLLRLRLRGRAGARA